MRPDTLTGPHDQATRVTRTLADPQDCLLKGDYAHSEGDITEVIPNAVASFTKAREALNPADHRTRGLFLSRAATAHIEQGDLGADCAAAHEVLGLAATLQPARFDSHGTSMIQQLHPVAHSPYAQEVLERRATVTATGSWT